MESEVVESYPSGGNKISFAIEPNLRTGARASETPILDLKVTQKADKRASQIGWGDKHKLNGPIGAPTRGTQDSPEQG